MPIIDSEYGIYIKDSKPVKICQYIECPSFPNYGKMKMKACQQCGFVRYCTKTCQRRDWPEHKKVCKIPPLVDIGAWIRAYRWLFQWAAYEALGHGGVNKTSTHSLQVSLIRTDRLVGPTPCHFFVDKIQLVETQPDVYGPYSTTPPAQETRNAEIQRAGGLGSTIVKYTVSGGDMLFWRNDTIELTEPVSFAPTMPGWQDIVRAVANGDMDQEGFATLTDCKDDDETSDVDEVVQGIEELSV